MKAQVRATLPEVMQHARRLENRVLSMLLRSLPEALLSDNSETGVFWKSRRWLHWANTADWTRLEPPFQTSAKPPTSNWGLGGGGLLGCGTFWLDLIGNSSSKSKPCEVELLDVAGIQRVPAEVQVRTGDSVLTPRVWQVTCARHVATCRDRIPQNCRGVEGLGSNHTCS